MPTTSEHPEQRNVLSEIGTTTANFLSHGLTETQRKIFYRLLVDLFVDNPQRRQSQVKKGSDTNESISTSTGN